MTTRWRRNQLSAAAESLASCALRCWSAAEALALADVSERPSSDAEALDARRAEVVSQLSALSETVFNLQKRLSAERFKNRRDVAAPITHAYESAENLISLALMLGLRVAVVARANATDDTLAVQADLELVAHVANAMRASLQKANDDLLPAMSSALARETASRLKITVAEGADLEAARWR
jgi:hypothetical protein